MNLCRRMCRHASRRPERPPSFRCASSAGPGSSMREAAEFLAVGWQTAAERLVTVLADSVAVLLWAYPLTPGLQLSAERRYDTIPQPQRTVPPPPGAAGRRTVQQTAILVRTSDLVFADSSSALDRRWHTRRPAQPHDIEERRRGNLRRPLGCRVASAVRDRVDRARGPRRPARNSRRSSSSRTPSRTTRSPAAFRDRVRRTTVAGMQALHLRKNRPVSLPRSLRRSSVYHA